MIHVILLIKLIINLFLFFCFTDRGNSSASQPVPTSPRVSTRRRKPSGCVPPVTPQSEENTPKVTQSPPRNNSKSVVTPVSKSTTTTTAAIEKSIETKATTIPVNNNKKSTTLVEPIIEIKKVTEPIIEIKKVVEPILELKKVEPSIVTKKIVDTNLVNLPSSTVNKKVVENIVNSPVTVKKVDSIIVNSSSSVKKVIETIVPIKKVENLVPLIKKVENLTTPIQTPVKEVKNLINSPIIKVEPVTVISSKVDNLSIPQIKKVETSVPIVSIKPIIEIKQEIKKEINLKQEEIEKEEDEDEIIEVARVKNTPEKRCLTSPRQQECSLIVNKVVVKSVTPNAATSSQQHLVPSATTRLVSSRGGDNEGKSAMLHQTRQSPNTGVELHQQQHHHQDSRRGLESSSPLITSGAGHSLTILPAASVSSDSGIIIIIN